MDNIDEVLISTCKTMIKTILACLDVANKGTIYRVGLMPGLRVVRVMSGIRLADSDEIEWGLPAVSDYNPPGKNWTDYRDQPGRVLEAMGWCVERQLSWTADNPQEDRRSVRKQLADEPEDVYHMEPVLVSKKSLYGESDQIVYPTDWSGNPIWQDSEYVVAAVIKIHFQPNALKRGDRSTRVIRELSQSLGAEMLSLYYRETLNRARKDFARHRLQSCEILAHELRNTLVKLGFVFSAINAQISILREDWEHFLQTQVPGLEWKGPLLEELSGQLSRNAEGLSQAGELFMIGQELLHEQRELARLSLSPYQEQEWLRNKIYPRWERFLEETSLWDKNEITLLLERLSRSLRTGMNLDLTRKINGLRPELAQKWAKLAYIQITSSNLFQIDEVIQLIEHPELPLRHKEQIRRVLKSLKSLVLTIPEVEEKATKILQSLRHGTWEDFQCSCEHDQLDLESGGRT
ncbi:MAG: hypothetical protein LLG06_09635 [Desulfobacteraceae bacterium]|nr:hypothetical protein [Desulfobacteraceae bacterium]